MYMKALVVVALAWLTVLCAGYADDAGDAILGTWVTEGGHARIEISKARNTYQGKIVWLKEPKYPQNDPEAGKQKRDRGNPDKSRRDRPIVGLMLLEGFKYAGKQTWSKGAIYDPENGKTYKCKLTLKNPKTLHVRGYVGISLIGRTTVWRRYQPPSEVKEPQKGRKLDKAEGRQARNPAKAGKKRE